MVSKTKVQRWNINLGLPGTVALSNLFGILGFDVIVQDRLQRALSVKSGLDTPQRHKLIYINMLVHDGPNHEEI